MVGSTAADLQIGLADRETHVLSAESSLSRHVVAVEVSPGSMYWEHGARTMMAVVAMLEGSNQGFVNVEMERCWGKMLC